MIKDSSLKKYQYQVPGLLDDPEVSEILDRVEKLARKVKNRTHLFPELGSRSSSNPIGKFSPGVEIVIDQVESIECFFLKRDLQSLSVRTIETFQRTLSHWGQTLIALELRHLNSNRNLSVSMIVDDEGTFWDIRTSGLAVASPTERAEWTSYVTSIGGLPVELGWVNSNEFILKHKEGGKLDVGDFGEPKVNVVSYLCEVLNAAPQDLLRVLLAYLNSDSFSLKESSWSLLCRDHVKKGTPSADEVFRTFDTAKVPGGDVTINFFWVLENYRAFPQMAAIAQEEVEGTTDVAQSLLEFSWDKNRKGQIDAATRSGSGLKLWFSFDHADDQASFTKATKIKLKPTS